MTRTPARLIAAVLLGAALPVWACTGPVVAQGAPPPAPPVARADISTFQAQLRPLGEFLRIPRLGLGWRPAYVPEDWRPYSVGRWIWNDRVGWYFSSQEPWAEITYHYGRWYQDPVAGWVWFSGTRWAPAWVEWRRDREFVGWRPLPPDDLPPPPRGGPRPYDTRYQDTWVFVPTREIAADDLRPARLPRERIVEIYERTQPIGRIEQRGRLTVNQPFRPDAILRDADVEIRSRNLPQSRAVPVPPEIRAISSEPRVVAQPYAPPPGGPGAPEAGRPGGPGPERGGPGMPPRGPGVGPRPGDAADPRGAPVAPVVQGAPVAPGAGAPPSVPPAGVPSAAPTRGPGEPGMPPRGPGAGSRPEEAADPRGAPGPARPAAPSPAGPATPPPAAPAPAVPPASAPGARPASPATPPSPAVPVRPAAPAAPTPPAAAPVPQPERPVARPEPARPAPAPRAESPQPAPRAPSQPQLPREQPPAPRPEPPRVESPRAAPPAAQAVPRPAAPPAQAGRPEEAPHRGGPPPGGGRGEPGERRPGEPGRP